MRNNITNIHIYLPPTHERNRKSSNSAEGLKTQVVLPNSNSLSLPSRRHCPGFGLYYSYAFLCLYYMYCLILMLFNVRYI